MRHGIHVHFLHQRDVTAEIFSEVHRPESGQNVWRSQPLNKMRLPLTYTPSPCDFHRSKAKTLMNRMNDVAALHQPNLDGVQIWRLGIPTFWILNFRLQASRRLLLSDWRGERIASGLADGVHDLGFHAGCLDKADNCCIERE